VHAADRLDEPVALEIALTAVQHWQRTKNRANRAVAELRLGQTYHHRANYLDAAEVLEMARYDFEQADLLDNPDVRQTYELLAECQAELGEHVDAARTLERIATLLRTENRPAVVAPLLNRAGDELRKGSEPLEAAAKFAEAAALYQASGAAVDAIQSMRDQVDALADANHLVESHEVAVLSERRAAALPAGSKRAWLVASTTYDIGYVYWQLDLNEDAVKVFEKARELYEEGGFQAGAGWSARLASQVYLELGKLGKARRAATAALAHFAADGRGKNDSQVSKTRKLLETIKQAKQDRAAGENPP
jgi:tetratricopeptide (TPR) repeat protein